MRTLSSSTFLIIAALSAPCAARLCAQTAPYASVDRIENDWVNRNPVPIRPMALGSGTSVWAVNPYLSWVNRIDGGVIVQSFATLPGPIAVAPYTPPVGPPLLMVVCQHANAVVAHNANTGDIMSIVRTLAMPQDVLVDQANQRMWVSCAAADQVIEVDLANPSAPQRRYAIPSKFATNLAFGPNNEVLVSPRISGNGSLAHRAPSRSASIPTTMAGSSGILDTLQSSVANPGQGLPDNDVFWLDRTGSGVVRPLFRTVGTLLFGCAMQPNSGNKLWQLNTDANNKDPNRQSEAAIRGEIVFNRVTVMTLPALVSTVQVQQAPPAIVLDDTDPVAAGIQYSSTDPIGNPYSLAFNSTGTTCYVVGLLTDNVLELDGSGLRTGVNVHLPAGTMPRHVLLDSAGTGLWVWGADNSVTKVAIGTWTQTRTSLGFDPTPAKLKKGRVTFFDGSHSLHKNASCASCHDEGRTDMLLWNLSHVVAATNDGPDNKGPMVTQTLTGIDRAMPFHWRGEQRNGLIDFNAAFPNLLGGAQLHSLSDPPGPNPAPIEGGDEFENFQAYILSLTEDANQFENFFRVLDTTIQPPTWSALPAGNAIDGQTVFNDASRQLACLNCHPMPTGSSNEIVSNDFTDEMRTKRLWLKNAPFQGLQHKATQRRQSVTLGNPPQAASDYALIGTGLAHAGVNPDVFQFAEIMLDDPVEILNVANFLFQFDTGIAPSAHGFVLVRQNNVNSPTTQGLVDAFVSTTPNPGEATVAKRNCDVAVIGKVSVGGTVRPVRWVYERDTDVFRRDDNATNTRFEMMAEVASSSTKWLVFIGLPPGTGRAFAIDFDRDMLPNMLEPTSIPDSQFLVDSDGDGFWDGQEFFNPPGDPADPNLTPPADLTPPNVTFLPTALVDPGTWPFQWVTERVARLTFETDEPARVDMTLTPVIGNPVEVHETRPKMRHNLVINTMSPGQTYQVALSVKDLSNNAVNNPAGTPPTLTTKSPRQNAAIVSALSMPAPTETAGVLTFTVTCTVTDRQGVAQTNMVVVGRVFVDGVLATAAANGFSLPSGVATALAVDNTLYTVLNPPLVISAPSGSGNTVSMTFSLNKPAVGSKIEFAVEAIGQHLLRFQNTESIRSGFNVALNAKMPGAWSFPDTAKDARSVAFTVLR